MSVKGELLSEAERSLIKKITAIGFFVPCVIDPAIYTLNVHQSKKFSHQEKKLMIQQTWVHNLCNLVMEAFSYVVFAFGASVIFKNKPKVELIKEAAPIIGVCLFKSLIRPFAMFRAALKLGNKPKEAPPTVMQTFPQSQAIAPRQNSTHALLNPLHHAPSLQGNPLSQPILYRPLPLIRPGLAPV